MEALIVVVVLWLFGIPIYLLVKHAALNDKLGRVEAELDVLRRWIANSGKLTQPTAERETGMAPEQQGAPAPEPQTSRYPFEAPATPPPTPPPPPVEEKYPTLASEGGYMAPPPLREEQQTAPPRQMAPQRPYIQPEPSRTKQEWEALIGGKLLNRIGALALIFGVGFFLKYAFDNNWISETVRVIIGIVAGAGLLFVGNHFHKKNFAIFAQGVIGAGIAILYLSVYAAFNYYHLVGQLPAVFMMGAVTAVTFFFAVRHDALPIALLGWAGGFLTPILLSTEVVNEARLFSYLAILDFGMLALTVKKPAWEILEPLSFVATFAFYFAWYDSNYTPADLTTTALFLSIFWGIFLAAEFWHNGKGTIRKNIHEPMSIGNAGLYCVTMNAILHDQYLDWAAALTLALGVVYTAGYLLFSRGKNEGARSLAFYLPVSAFLLAVATWLEFDKFRLVMAWSSEALALFWIGIFFKRREVWGSALGLFVVALCSLGFHPETVRFSPMAHYVLVLNERTISLLVLAIALALGAIFSRKIEGKEQSIVRDMLNLGWFGVLFLAVTVESLDYFRHRLFLNGYQEPVEPVHMYRNMTLVAIWAVYTLGVLWIGLRSKLTALTGIAILAAVFVVLFAIGNGFVYYPIDQFTLLFNIRAAAFLIMAVVLYLQSRLLALESPGQEWQTTAVTALRISLGIFVLYFISVETWSFFEALIVPLRNDHYWPGGRVEEIRRWVNLQQLSLSGIWLVYSVVLMVLGIWRRRQPLRIMSIALFGITILKIFIYDLSFLSTLYRIFSFIGLGVILLAVSYSYQRFKGLIFGEAPSAPQAKGEDRS